MALVAGRTPVTLGLHTVHAARYEHDELSPVCLLLKGLG